VSRLLGDHARIYVGATGVKCHYCTGKWFTCIPEHRSFFVAPQTGAATDEGGLHRALCAAIEVVKPTARSADVVISNQLARYCLVPWRDDLRNHEEELAYAKDCMVEIYGEAAREWIVRVNTDRPGANQLACALDPELLATFNAVEDKTKFKFRSIQPSLVDAFNHSRAKITRKSVWLALAEGSQLCLAYMNNRRWQWLRTVRVDAQWRQSIRKLIAAECCLAGIDGLDAPALIIGPKPEIAHVA